MLLDDIGNFIDRTNKDACLLACSESCVMAGNANHYIATPQYSNRRCSNIKAFFVDF